MLPLLAGLKGLTKLQTFTIDNQVFRLHYKFTVLVLAVFSLVVTYSQFFGDSIACTQTSTDNTPQKVVELYCWTHHTYSYKDAFEKEVGVEGGVIYPGISQKQKGSEVVQHKYYQWVCFVLALQAVLFYVPRYLWKALEGERVKNLVLGLNVPTIESEEARKKQEVLLRYLKNHKGGHFGYTLSYVLCELLNFANVIGQMYLLDTFLGGEFTKFGIRVLNFIYEHPSERVDPMIRVFPRMTICHFFTHGPTGNFVRNDYYCILPLNVINEKIFIYLWFWFLVLLALTTLGLIYRSFVFLVPAFRVFVLKFRCPMSNRTDVEKVTYGSSIGDWFILYQLAKNVESEYMADILRMYAECAVTDKQHNSWAATLNLDGSYCIEGDVV